MQKIILVEDEEADIVHFRRVSKKLNLSADVVVARDGDEALEVLRQASGQCPRRIVVTDLNMPGMTGHELIEEIRADPVLRTSIIFVFSTSDLADDIERAYQKNIAGYIVKDPHGQRLEAGISMLEKYIEAVSI